MPFLLIFIIIPLIEIAFFIQIGGVIGLGMTLLLCLVTAVGGAILIRLQGIRTLLTAQDSLREMKIPLTALFDGICLVIAGALLLTPGFFTDGIGFALLVPRFRRWLRQKALPWIAARTGFSVTDKQTDRHNEYTIIEGEFEQIDPDSKEG